MNRLQLEKKSPLQIAVTLIEQFPTQLILKTLPKIDRSRRYLRDAHKFIKQEKVIKLCKRHKTELTMLPII